MVQAGFFLRFRFGDRKEILRDRLEEFERPVSIDVISGHYILRDRFGPSKHLKKNTGYKYATSKYMFQHFTRHFHKALIQTFGVASVPTVALQETFHLTTTDLVIIGTDSKRVPKLLHDASGGLDTDGKLTPISCGATFCCHQR